MGPKIDIPENPPCKPLFPELQKHLQEVLLVLLPRGVTEKEGNTHGFSLTAKEGKGKAMASGEITPVTEHGEECLDPKTLL
jgi:hypothetical protein